MIKRYNKDTGGWKIRSLEIKEEYLLVVICRNWGGFNYGDEGNVKERKKIVYWKL